MLTNDQIATKITNLMWGNYEIESAGFAVQLFMEHLLLEDKQESWTRDEMYQLIKEKLRELDKVKGTIFENATV
ncbi:hypothetical protein GRF59_14540 [Paenibacillus sp. HJL G12]|uniref:Uncharacterized protein n=1 Tax=Paenibacillus dendrobii TaxID=2691084 RepID=A0A7X3IK51_9BACL|nr:hypothetical protein [Paenibacillus dendrobii]MWV44836.1 hypothetical protein [Paenibacillus dendrobii]